MELATLFLIMLHTSIHLNHLVVGLSAYLVLKKYMKKLQFIFFVFAVMLPDLDIILDWIFYFTGRSHLVIWGFLHEIIPGVTFALAVAIFAQVFFGHEKNPSKFKWLTISVVLGVLFSILFNLPTQPGVPIFAPISYQPNPFGSLLTTNQGDIAVTSISLVLLLIWFYSYGGTKRPVIEIENEAVEKILKSIQKLSYLQLVTHETEKRFILLVIIIEIVALSGAMLGITAAIPDLAASILTFFLVYTAYMHSLKI